MSRKKNNAITVDKNEVIETEVVDTVTTEEVETRSVETDTVEDETVVTIEEEKVETVVEETEVVEEIVEPTVEETPAPVVEAPVVEAPVVKGDAIFISGKGPVVGYVSGSVAKNALLTSLSGTSVKATAIKPGDCIIVTGPGKVKRFIVVGEVGSAAEVAPGKLIVR